MTLPEPVSQAARWALVIGLAYFCADATSALVGKRLSVSPKPLPQTAVGVLQENVPAQAPPPSLVSLLETTGGGDEIASEDGSGGPNRPGGGTIRPAAAPAKPASVLKLRGTMAGADGSGLAMIDLNGQTQVLSTGEQVAGMTLLSVTSYSVTLGDGNGGTAVLDMNSDAPVSTTALAAQQEQVQPNPEPTPTETPQTDGEEGQGDSGAILTQRELRNILDNPAEFAGRGFRMKPVLNGGEIIGMRVSLNNPSHPLARLGIQNGDIVKSLNGTPLNGPEALSNVYRVLRNTSSLNFEVERGGATQNVEITLEE